jgi:hypothetical protein
LGYLFYINKSALDLGKCATPADQAKGPRARMRSKNLKKALAFIGIALHDLLIVAGTNCFRLKSLGHL